jgi:dTDP-4-dehydrorhamnose 3,5-epimerase|tara:strand:- start:127 stop:657 length:531 start_codon:yes stop_codon:yes gene_type:complete
MEFTKISLEGAYIIEIEKIEDERGFFARSWDKEEFKKKKLDCNLLQCSISFNKKKGTIRGLHYQLAPFEETKLVRCTRGKIYDVIVDLRKSSKTYKKWVGVELSENNHKIMYIPKGFAHGFQTLKDDSEIFYQISEYHKPKYYAGVCWNDPSFNIKWPIELSVISKKDSSYPFYTD